jgi:acetyl-CoA synthetase
VIGLCDLRVPDARSWEDAHARFRFPQVDRYNIAADCLRAPADAPALLPAGERPVSFGELAERAAGFAGALRERGVERGDRVAVKLGQSLDMAVAVLGALWAGAIVVTVSNVLGEAAVRHRLADAEPRVVVTGPLPPVAGGEPVATRPDDPALLLYTSGTTGRAKGVLHGHRVLLGHHGVDWALDGIRPGDVSYSPVDWAWAGGLFLGLLVPLAHGIPVVVFREPRFDAARTLAVLREHGVSVGLFPPTVLRMLRQSGRAADGLRLRCLVTGAEAVEPDLFAWAAEHLGVRVNNAYGQTEANALVGHSGLLGDLDPACLGRPYPGHRIAVLDETLEPVAPGEIGQLAVAADDPVCMLGYWRDPAATEAKLGSGWMPTGDGVHGDEGGRLFFHGRGDDLIKSGGYRIGPAEVEAALLAHPAVADCAVVGLPDPVRGQAVTAFVRLRDPGEQSDALGDELRRAVRERVGAHAYPRDVAYVSELPRTPMGKLDRARLRAR